MGGEWHHIDKKIKNKLNDKSIDELSYNLLFKSIKKDYFKEMDEKTYKKSFNRHFNKLLNSGDIIVTGYVRNEERKPGESYVDYRNLLFRLSKRKDPFDIRKLLIKMEKSDEGGVDENAKEATKEIRTRFKKRLNDIQYFEKERWNRLKALTFYTTPKSVKNELGHIYSLIETEINSLDEAVIQKLLIMYFGIPEKRYTPIDPFEDLPEDLSLKKMDLEQIVERDKKIFEQRKNIIWARSSDHAPAYDQPIDWFSNESSEEDTKLYSSLMKKSSRFRIANDSYGPGWNGYTLGVLTSLLPFYEKYRSPNITPAEMDMKMDRVNIWFYPCLPEEFQNIWHMIPTPNELGISPKEISNTEKPEFNGFFKEMFLFKPFKVNLFGDPNKDGALCEAGFFPPVRKYGDKSPFTSPCWPRYRKFPTPDFAFRYTIDIISTYSNKDKEVLWGILAKALSDETGAQQVFMEFYDRIEKVNYGNRLNSVLGIVS